MKQETIFLHKSLTAWGQAHFSNTFKEEMEALDIESLPLQSALQFSSHVSDSGFHLNIYSIQENSQTITVRSGIFYHGIIAGCNCADDPTPVEEQTEYCEIESAIDKFTAETRFSLIGSAI